MVSFLENKAGADGCLRSRRGHDSYPEEESVAFLLQNASRMRPRPSDQYNYGANAPQLIFASRPAHRPLFSREITTMQPRD